MEKNVSDKGNNQSFSDAFKNLGNIFKTGFKEAADKSENLQKEMQIAKSNKSIEEQYKELIEKREKYFQNLNSNSTALMVKDKVAETVLSTFDILKVDIDHNKFKEELDNSQIVLPVFYITYLDYEMKYKNKICPICNKNYLLNSLVTETHCGHDYHNLCYSFSEYNKIRVCPTCNLPIFKKMENTLQIEPPIITK